MKQVQIRNALRAVEIDKLISSTTPELIIELILYFTYSSANTNKNGIQM
jgi:hypothetical protein